MKDDSYRHVLHEFRADIFGRLSLVFALFSLAVSVLLVYTEPLPHQFIVAMQVFSGLVLYLRYFSARHLNAARYLFVAALFVLLGIGMVMLPDITWLPFVAAPLLLVSELLVSRASFAAGALVVGFAGLLVRLGYADYPVESLLIFILFVVVVSHSTLRTIWVLLHWYFYMFGKSNALLEETRAHRADVVQTLKSLEIARETQQRLQTQLIYARQQADEARRMKERFASNISHELRTPLNIILGFSEIMHVTPEVYGAVNFPPKLQQDIYQIHRNSRHLLDMIDDVLDLSHIEMTQFSLNFERTDLTRFLQDTVDLVSHLFRDKPIAFVVQLANHLPEIQIDRTRIRQVIINLLNNAQRFTFEGSVTFSVHADDKDVIFEVADTGIGIPAEQMPLIFEEFFQVDYSLSRSTGGAGLGLAITRRFIEAHDGHLHVESQEGVGSTFTFTLPLPTQTRLAAQVARRTEAPIRETLWLVLDADPHVSKLIVRHTQACTIIQVDSADQLDEAIRRYSPQGVIVNNPRNANLPDTLANLPVPVVTCSLPSTTLLVTELGVNACLAKPILPAELITQLQLYPAVETVLVIDDDVGVVQLVQRTLEHHFPRLTLQRAYNGQQACDMMQAAAPDLVLLDLVMPMMSGFDVIDAMKADERLRDVPVVLLTATKYVQSDDESRGDLHIRQDGGLKPTDVLKLLNLITQTVNA